MQCHETAFWGCACDGCCSDAAPSTWPAGEHPSPQQLHDSWVRFDSVVAPGTLAALREVSQAPSLAPRSSLASWIALAAVAAVGGALLVRLTWRNRQELWLG